MARRDSASGLTVLTQGGFTVFMLWLGVQMMKAGEGSGLLWLVSWVGGGLLIWWLIDGRD